MTSFLTSMFDVGIQHCQWAIDVEKQNLAVLEIWSL